MATPHVGVKIIKSLCSNAALNRFNVIYKKQKSLKVLLKSCKRKTLLIFKIRELYYSYSRNPEFLTFQSIPVEPEKALTFDNS